MRIAPLMRSILIFAVPPQSIIMDDACAMVFTVTVSSPVSLRMRRTLESVRSSSRKHPVCILHARAFNSTSASGSIWKSVR